jgi:hypothetical protein
MYNHTPYITLLNSIYNCTIGIKYNHTPCITKKLITLFSIRRSLKADKLVPCMMIQGGAFVYPSDLEAELWNTDGEENGNFYEPVDWGQPTASAAVASASAAAAPSGSNNSGNTNDNTSSTPQLPVGSKRKVDEQLQSATKLVIDLTDD